MYHLSDRVIKKYLPKERKCKEQEKEHKGSYDRKANYVRVEIQKGVVYNEKRDVCIYA